MGSFVCPILCSGPGGTGNAPGTGTTGTWGHKGQRPGAKGMCQGVWTPLGETDRATEEKGGWQGSQTGSKSGDKAGDGQETCSVRKVTRNTGRGRQRTWYKWTRGEDPRLQGNPFKIGTKAGLLRTWCSLRPTAGSFWRSPALGFPCPRRLQNRTKRTNHTNRTDCPDRAELADIADLVAFPSTSEEETCAEAQKPGRSQGQEGPKRSAGQKECSGLESTDQEQREHVQQRQKRQGEQKGADREACRSSPEREVLSWDGRGLRKRRERLNRLRGRNAGQHAWAVLLGCEGGPWTEPWDRQGQRARSILSVPVKHSAPAHCR